MNLVRGITGAQLMIVSLVQVLLNKFCFACNISCMQRRVMTRLLGKERYICLRISYICLRNSCMQMEFMEHSS